MGKADGNHRALLNNSKISRVLDPWTPAGILRLRRSRQACFREERGGRNHEDKLCPQRQHPPQDGGGNFSYDKNVRPHAVTEVENTDGKIPENGVTREFYYLISHHKFI